jgi:methionyl-tRNA formyltransferase
MSSLHIVFAGTPEFALPCLKAIHASQHALHAVYTQPDRPAGRGQQMQPSAVKVWAQAHQIPIHQPLNFKDQRTRDELAALSPDLMVVIAYGLILPQSVLNVPRLGCINVHASLLPRWRGASPIQQALLHGDPRTGVTIMQMNAGMDTGPILSQISYDMTGHETSETLQETLAHLGVNTLIDTLNALASGETLHPQAQADSGITYAPKITKADAMIDWSKSAQEIHQKIRAYYPWPIAYTAADGVLLKIHQASMAPRSMDQPPGTIVSIEKEGILVTTGHGTLNIERLQFPNAKHLSIAEWLNGRPTQLSVGMILQ